MYTFVHITSLFLSQRKKGKKQKKHTHEMDIKRILNNTTGLGENFIDQQSFANVCSKYIQHNSHPAHLTITLEAIEINGNCFALNYASCNRPAGQTTCV